MGGSTRIARRQAAPRRWLDAAGALVFWLAGAAMVAATEPAGASTSATAQADARRSVPLAKIDPAYRAQVAEVLADPSLFRRMPTNVIDCDPDLFTYFAENPEALVEIWRTLGVSQCRLTRTGERTFDVSDGAGTTGKLVVVEQTCEPGAQNRVVMFVEGSYEGKPFQRPVSATCVLVLTSGSMEETNGRRYVASRLDAFIKLDRMSLELVAKAVHPLVGQTADRNFADTLSFVSNFSYTAEHRPETIAKLAEEVEQLDRPRRDELARLAHQCAANGRHWQSTRKVSATAVR